MTDARADASSPVLDVTDDLVSALIRLGGYVHPLFAQTGEHAAVDVGPPLPGQALLLLAGGLAEQSGELDRARVMVELRSVRFLELVRAGSRLSLALYAGDERRTSGGSILREYRWELTNGPGRVVMEADVLMLMNS